jgi:hypothetical protein
MIRPGTVFVLGAGASSELDFPLGVGLRGKIKSLCSRRQPPDGFPRYVPSPVEEYCGTQVRLADSLGTSKEGVVRAQETLRDTIDAVDSIDQFLGLHCSDGVLTGLGKLAITRAIAEAERSSAIYWRHGNHQEPQFSNADQAWTAYLQRLWVLLSDGLDGSNIETMFEGTTFINFNYDRSLEYFFYIRLRQLLRMRKEDACSVIEAMRVIRPYGSIGSGPCDETDQDGKVVFGAELAGDRLLAASKQIRVISDDRLGDNAVAEQAHAAIAASRNVVMLGCAFHQANLRLLKISANAASPRENRNRRVWCTAHGIDDIGLPYIRDQLHRVFVCPQESITLSNSHTAAQLCAAIQYPLRNA